MNETVASFISELRSSLAAGSFVKLTLGNYKGADEHLQRILVRLIKTRKGKRLYFQLRYERRDVAKNYDLHSGVAEIEEVLGRGFRNAHLFTTEADVQLDIGKRSARINKRKPTFTKAAATEHDRPKTHLVDRKAFYLKALGITNETGEVLAQKHDKWKQIHKFVEIVDGLFRRSALSRRQALNIVDMGSGKGYLTFALYDHFANTLGLNVTLTGVEHRKELVEKCNSIAVAGEYAGLHFITGSIADYHMGDVDILVALHACDTATDDALFAGIRAEANVIIAAPCCQHEVRDQMCSPDFFAGMLKHSVLFERTAESITDGVRSLLLERAGYNTKMFEFVAAEHTPKNNLLIAVKHDISEEPVSIDQQIAEVFRLFCIREQRLSKLMETDL